jgi:hypothetical protein
MKPVKKKSRPYDFVEDDILKKPVKRVTNKRERKPTKYHLIDEEEETEELDLFAFDTDELDEDDE